MNLMGLPVSQKPPKPMRSKAYLQWVASHGCLVCGGPAQAHHLRIGPRTMGKRQCDTRTVPLCPGHHKVLHESYGKEEDFWADFPALKAAALYEGWRHG